MANNGYTEPDNVELKTYDGVCQPTSSKILVEDLITDEDDDKHEQEHHSATAETVAGGPHPDRKFWDTPSTPAEMHWPDDQRMPVEWNMVNEDMRL